MASVKLTDVKKVYDNKVTAVHDFNLDIKDKEFVVFVGPSGCGKSTTMRMIAGLEDISGGTVEIDGVVVNDLQPKDRDIAMVFQNYALYPHMTVYDNIAFSLRLKKMPEDQVYEKLTAAAEVLGITEFFTRNGKNKIGVRIRQMKFNRSFAGAASEQISVFEGFHGFLNLIAEFAFRKQKLVHPVMKMAKCKIGTDSA